MPSVSSDWMPGPGNKYIISRKHPAIMPLATHTDPISSSANNNTNSNMEMRMASTPLPAAAWQEEAKTPAEGKTLHVHALVDLETVCITAVTETKPSSQSQEGEEQVPPYHASGWRAKFGQLKFHYLDTERFVTSHFLPAWGLLCARIVLVCYALATLISSAMLDFDHGLWFRCCTQLTYIGMTIYLLLAAIHTALYVRQGVEGKPRSFEAQPRWLNLAYWILYEAMFTFKIIVPILFWSCLRDWAPVWSDSQRAWTNFSLHGMDGVLMLIEFSCNRQIFVFGHIYFFVAFVLGFCVYTWIFYFAGFGWTYWFMDITTPAAWYRYPILICFGCLIWTACFFVHVGREKLAMRFSR